MFFTSLVLTLPAAENGFPAVHTLSKLALSSWGEKLSAKSKFSLWNWRPRPLVGFYLAEDREVCFQFARAGAEVAPRGGTWGITRLNTSLPKTIILPASITCLSNWCHRENCSSDVQKGMTWERVHQGKGIWVIKYISMILYICLRFFFSHHWNFLHHFVLKAVLY